MKKKVGKKSKMIKRRGKFEQEKNSITLNEERKKEKLMKQPEHEETFERNKEKLQKKNIIICEKINVKVKKKN